MNMIKKCTFNSAISILLRFVKIWMYYNSMMQSSPLLVHLPYKVNGTNDGTLKDTVPVAGHPYKIIFPSLFSTRFVPELRRTPTLVRLPYSSTVSSYFDSRENFCSQTKLLRILLYLREILSCVDIDMIG